MKTFIVAASLAGLVTTSALAKGHNQGDTEVPGKNVGAETVASSQSLGSTKGNRPEDKAPANSASDKAGR